MHYLIGMDEAGYGPNLGPLVIAATAWKLDARYDADLQVIDLYELLHDVISRQPRSDRLAIADSKQIYNRATGIAGLELGVLAAMQAAGQAARSVRELLAATVERSHAINGLPSDAEFDEPLPVSADHAEVHALSAKLVDRCQLLGIQPPRIRARVVSPGEFNQLIEHCGNKAAALTHATLELLARLLAECEFNRHSDSQPGPPILCGLRQARRSEPLRGGAAAPLRRMVDRSSGRRTVRKSL